MHTTLRLLQVGLAWVLFTVVSTRTAEAIHFVDYTSIAAYGAPIRFDEVPYGTANPQYGIGPAQDRVLVSFGSHFLGQVLGSEPNTLADSSPQGPLALATTTPVKTSIDLAQGSVALGGGGVGYFTTPIAIAFDKPVAAVGLRGGHFQSVGNIFIEAYDLLGQSLGVLHNTFSGVNHLGIGSDIHRNQIAGVSIYLQPHDMDWEGFTVDNVVFERVPLDEEIDVNSTPEPAGLALWATCLAGIAGRRMRRARRD